MKTIKEWLLWKNPKPQFVFLEPQKNICDNLVNRVQRISDGHIFTDDHQLAERLLYLNVPGISSDKEPVVYVWITKFYDDCIHIGIELKVGLLSKEKLMGGYNKIQINDFESEVTKFVQVAIDFCTIALAKN